MRIERSALIASFPREILRIFLYSGKRTIENVAERKSVVKNGLNTKNISTTIAPNNNPKKIISTLLRSIIKSCINYYIQQVYTKGTYVC
jgi:hypothetical protein